MGIPLHKARINPPTHKNAWKSSWTKRWQFSVSRGFVIDQSSKRDLPTLERRTSICGFITREHGFLYLDFILFIFMNWRKGAEAMRGAKVLYTSWPQLVWESRFEVDGPYPFFDGSNDDTF